MPQPAARRTARPTPRRSGSVPAAARRRPRPRARRRSRLLGALSLAVLATSGIAHLAMGGLGDGIGRVDAFGGLDNRPPHSVGENFLLVGTDGRDRVTPQERRRYRLGGVPCHCTDTIMLAHLSPDRSRLSLVGIPRDSYVRLTGQDGRQDRPAKLNAAYSTGGPRLTVRTVERLTGVHIDHYLEVDFVSFMKTVDAIGGVPVCTAVPLSDPRSGLDLPAGRTMLTGGQALEYVRARYLDGSADLGRMRRQQRFMAELVRRAADSDVLLDPVTLTRTVDSALASIRADRDLRSADLVRLAEALRDLRPSAEQFVSVPVTPGARRVPGVGTTVSWDAPRAARLFAAIRADRPLPAARPAHHPAAAQVPVDPALVRVLVTGPGPAARHVAAALRAAGFRATTGPAAERTPPRTVIDYDPRWDRSVRSLAAALPAATRHPLPRLGGTLRVTLAPGRTTLAPVRFAPVAGTDGRGINAEATTGADELCA